MLRSELIYISNDVLSMIWTFGCWSCMYHM